MVEKKIDTLTLELLREALPAICDEMAVVLKRTAYNVVIYEVKDFAVSILDSDGELIARPRLHGSIKCISNLRDCNLRHRRDREGKFFPGRYYRNERSIYNRPTLE